MFQKKRRGGKEAVGIAIVWVEKMGGATVALRDDDCGCDPEEMAERRRKFDGEVRRILDSPAARENLRRINLERYGVAAGGRAPAKHPPKNPQ